MPSERARSAASPKGTFDQLVAAYPWPGHNPIVILVRLHPEVVDRIPDDPRLGATLIRDIERDRSAQWQKHLFSLIQTDLDLDPTLARLDQFDEDRAEHLGELVDGLPSHPGKVVDGDPQPRP